MKGTEIPLSDRSPGGGVGASGERADCLERVQAATPEFAQVDRGSTQSGSRSCRWSPRGLPRLPARPAETHAGCPSLGILTYPGGRRARELFSVVFSDSKAPGVKVFPRCLARFDLRLQGTSRQQR